MIAEEKKSLFFINNKQYGIYYQNNNKSICPLLNVLEDRKQVYTDF